MTAPITSLAQLDPHGTYSYADYLSWQFEGWEEILHGRLLPPPTHDEPHARVCGQLLARLHGAGAAQGLRAGYRTSLALAGPPDSVVVPDWLLVRPGHPFDAHGCLGAPAWIIEVTAPGSAARDWKAKFDLYEENGVGEYWIASPADASLSVFVLDAATARYRLVGEYAGPGPVPCATLPGLGLDWADVFDEARAR